MNERGSHVLLVDDEPMNLEILLDYLEDENLNLHTAVDGEDAYAFLMDPACPPLRAILLDRMMPKLDGLGLMARIKGIPHLAQIPIIIQTADASPERVAEGIAAGAYYYLTKPFERVVLLSILRSAIGDRLRVEEVQRRLEEGSRGASLLQQGRFAYRTHEQAQALATLLSQACPRPEQVALGIWELLINAVEHGNLEISYSDKTHLIREGGLIDEMTRRLTQAPYEARQAVVAFERSAEGVSLVIEDEGPGFDWKPYLELDPVRAFDPNGRGIAMARQLSFDELEYQGRGNRVAVTIRV